MHKTYMFSKTNSLSRFITIIIKSLIHNTTINCTTDYIQHEFFLFWGRKQRPIRGTGSSHIRVHEAEQGRQHKDPRRETVGREPFVDQANTSPHEFCTAALQT